MGSLGFGGGKSKSKSGTKFNEDFLNKFSGRYGDAPLIRSGDTPQAESVFTPRVEAQARGLGFGRAPEKVQAPAPITTNTVAAPTAQAARVAMPAGSRQGMERSIFASSFNPQAREFDRQAALQRRQLQGNVAGAGLGGSAAGIGLMQQQARDQSEQRAGLAADAGNRAAAASYQFEQQATLADAERQQATNLANAGFDAQAQQINAANALQGNLATAENYLKTVGLNMQQAQQARDSFLNMLGLRNEDMARVSDEQRRNLGLVFDSWLKTFGAVSGASQFGKSSSFNFNASAAVGSGG